VIREEMIPVDQVALKRANLHLVIKTKKEDLHLKEAVALNQERNLQEKV